MVAKVVLISTPISGKQTAELMMSLRPLLRGWQLTEVSADKLEAEAVMHAEAIVLVVCKRDQFLNAEIQLNKISEALMSGIEARLIPVLWGNAEMPTSDDLPKDLTWLQNLNAVRVNQGDLPAEVKRLANAIKHQATLTEPPAPSSLFWLAFRLGFRSMCFGPLWALLCVCCCFVLLCAVAICYPSILQQTHWLGGCFIFALWLSGVVAGMFAGSRLRTLGAWAGAAVGAVLPWLPFSLMSVVYMPQVVVSMVSKGQAAKPTSDLVFTPPMLLLAILLCFGFLARRDSDGKTRFVRTWRLWSPWIFGILAIIGGELLGRNEPVVKDMSAFKQILAFGLNIAASGVLMGFARGFFLALDRRRSVALGLVPHSSSDIQQTIHSLASKQDGRSGREVPAPAMFNKWQTRNVFLSYRRADSALESSRIHHELGKQIGGLHVFRDVDSIPYGIDFKAVLAEEIAKCDVFVVIIGPSWQAIVDEHGRRRLECDDDYVRQEIELALEKGVPVLLALVNGTPHPRSEDLPQSIRALANCSSVVVSRTMDLTSLCNAISGMPARTNRNFAMRERLNLSLRFGARNGFNWALAGMGLTIVATVLLLLGVREAMMENWMSGVALGVGPMIFGWRIGSQIWGRKAAIVGLIAAPIFGVTLFAASYYSVAIGFIASRAMLRISGTTDYWNEVFAFLMFFGAASGCYLSVKAVLADRLRRIRTWGGVAKVVGMTATGSIVGFMFAGAICVSMPPADWPHFYRVAFWAGMITVNLGAFAFLEGALTAYFSSKR